MKSEKANTYICLALLVMKSTLNLGSLDPGMLIGNNFFLIKCELKLLLELQKNPVTTNFRGASIKFTKL